MESAQPNSGWTIRSAYAVVLLTLIYSLSYMDRYTLTAVLPSIKREMHLSDTALGALTGIAFVLLFATMTLPVARLAERLSRRNIIAIGLAFWSLMTGLTGFSANVWQLALTRFLMGAGESAGTAPVHSLLSDMFGKAQRPMVLSILTSGASIGVLVGLPLAGWMDQLYGWRAAFLVAAAPGLVLSVLLLLTVREPPRGGADAPGVPTDTVTFIETLRFLAGSRTYVTMNIGGACLAVYLFAVVTWSGVFLVRVHHLSPGEMGSWLGLVRGLSGLCGALAGGALASILGRRNERWRILVPSACCLMVAPAEALFLFAPNLAGSLIGLALATFMAGAPQGLIYATSVSVAKVRMRAVAAALSLFTASILGQVIGPLAVGFLNDQLHSRYGDLAIRYSMLLAAGFAVLAGVIMALGARTMVADSRRADL